MKRFSKLFAVLTALAIIFSSTACTENNPEPNEVSSETLKIGILKWLTHGALDSAEKGFVDALSANGYKDGENISIDYQNANDNASIAATISDRLINNKTDLILAIATPAVQSIQNKTTTISILGTAVTDFVEANLVESNEKPGKNITGASDLTPVSEQFELLKRVLPDVQTVGILYNSSEANSKIQADTATEVAESLGISAVVKTFSSVNDIPQTAESLAKEVDAFWIPTDNTLASAISILSAKTIENGIPVVCSEENQVIGGGTFTIGIDYYQLGYQTGEMAVRILKDGAKPADMPIEYQNKMSIAINKEAADKIGLVFPQDVLDEAKDMSSDTL